MSLLGLEFLKSDMDRLDNPEYFMKDFQCTQLIKFFASISTMKDINQKRDELNLFFDRFINGKRIENSIYVQIKWTIILHILIQKYNQQSPLYGYTFKALQKNLEIIVSFYQKQRPYQKYLTDKLVKPYIQYLCKLCLLNMPEQTLKYDERSASELQTSAFEGENPQVCSDKVLEEKQNVPIKLVQWYRRYNFVSQTLQTFQQVLHQVRNFFKVRFPFLNSIGKLINQDVNSLIFKLKYSYRILKKLNVTLLQLDKLDSKIKLFTSNNTQYIEDKLQLTQKNSFINRGQLQQFLQSPLKPFQLRLFSKKSIPSPIPQNM